LLLYSQTVIGLHGQSGSAQVAAAIERASASYSSAVVLDGSTDFGPGRHTGPHRFRSNVYSTACSCFVYAGPYQEIPSP
jgi:hypothetical protein